MAKLKDVARYEANTIREGIAWVIIWKTGRSWNAQAVWLNCEDETFEPEDLELARNVLEQDPNAVILNGYYCGHFSEDMTVSELATGIRWHYENGFNQLADSAAFPPEQVERPADLPADIPVDKHQYPNLVAEIRYHNAGSLYTCANYAGVSAEILEGFLSGDISCDLSASELNRLVQHVNFSFNGVFRSRDYLLSPKLSYYIPLKRKHYHKLCLVWTAVEASRKINPTITLLGKRMSVNDDLPSFMELCEMKIVPTALVNHAKEFVGDVYRRQSVSTQIYHPTVRVRKS